MRLFIALNFDEFNKDILGGITRDLAGIFLHGRPLSKDNHHLTLAFIGESTEVSTLEHCIDRAAGPAFEISTSKLDSFRRNGGDILWLSLKPEEQLTALQTRLKAELTANGFVLDNRPFRPHITLMREAVWPDRFDFSNYAMQIPQICQMMRKISLMESARVSGRLVYREIYTKALEP